MSDDCKHRAVPPQSPVPCSPAYVGAAACMHAQGTPFVVVMKSCGCMGQHRRQRGPCGRGAWTPPPLEAFLPSTAVAPCGTRRPQQAKARTKQQQSLPCGGCSQHAGHARESQPPNRLRTPLPPTPASGARVTKATACGEKPTWLPSHQHTARSRWLQSRPFHVRAIPPPPPPIQ